MTISEEMINHVYNTDSPLDTTDPGVNAVELAMEYNIQLGDISEAEDEPGQISAENLAPNSPSPSSSHPHTSPKGKEKAVESTLSNREAENAPGITEEEEDQEEEDKEQGKDKDKEEDIHPNAREPANDAVRTLEAQVLEHQSHR